MRTLAFFSIILLAITMKTSAQDANKLLWDLFENYDEYNLTQNPEGATYEGDHRFDDLLSDHSEEASNKYYDRMRLFLSELEGINYKSLNEENKLNYDLFARNLYLTLDGEKFKWHYMPLGQQGGIHIGFPQIVNVQPLSTYSEYQKYFKRLRGFDKQVTDVIANMKKGMKAGLVPPAFIIEQTLPQMESIMDADAEKSLFYLPINKENKLSAEEKENTAKELRTIINESINPAYKRLHDFVKNEYLPNCRKDAGIWSLPDGKERYENAVKYYT
ncbi:MAG: DUF885 domain-containing protein, partial [Ignavibacteria bacterium]